MDKRYILGGPTTHRGAGTQSKFIAARVTEREITADGATRSLTPRDYRSLPSVLLPGTTFPWGHMGGPSLGG